MTAPALNEVKPLLDKEIIIPTHTQLENSYSKPEEEKSIFNQWVTGMVLRQNRLAHDLPDIYPDLAFPEETTRDFYKKYFEANGSSEYLQTIDSRQLLMRLIHHPELQLPIKNSEQLRIGLAGCAGGIGNIESMYMRTTMRKRPRDSTTFVGIEPYAPESRNPLLDPFYAVRLEDMGTSDEAGQLDILTLLGSVMMDINRIIDRLDTYRAISQLVKFGGLVVFEQAAPPTDMPDQTGHVGLGEAVNYAYDTNLHQATGAPDIDTPGYFRRTWLDRNGKEFGKQFYGEPLVNMFLIMNQLGFTHTLGNLREVQQVLAEPHFNNPWSRLDILKSRFLPPDSSDLSQIAFQSMEGKWQRHTRLVTVWKHTHQADPEFLDLITKLHGNNLFTGIVKE